VRHVAGVVHQDDLVEQGRRGPVYDGVDGAQQRRPGLVVEGEDDAGLRVRAVDILLEPSNIRNLAHIVVFLCDIRNNPENHWDLWQGRPGPLRRSAPVRPQVGQAPVDGDHVTHIPGQAVAVQ
jgi:hypothetical protein